MKARKFIKITRNNLFLLLLAVSTTTLWAQDRPYDSGDDAQRVEALISLEVARAVEARADPLAPRRQERAIRRLGPEDVEKVVGRRVRLETNARRQWVGTINGIEGDRVVFRAEIGGGSADVTIPRTSIKEIRPL